MPRHSWAEYKSSASPGHEFLTLFVNLQHSSLDGLPELSQASCEHHLAIPAQQQLPPLYALLSIQTKLTSNLDLAWVTGWRSVHLEGWIWHRFATKLHIYGVLVNLLGRVGHCVCAISIVLDLGTHVVSSTVLLAEEGEANIGMVSTTIVSCRSSEPSILR